jgi:hypothetical protein
MPALSSRQKSQRTFLLALIASVILHLLLLNGPAWQLPSLQDKTPQQLEARIEPLPPKPVAKIARKDPPPQRAAAPKPKITPAVTPAPAAPVPEPPAPPEPTPVAEAPPEPPKPRPGEQLPSQAEIRYSLNKGENGLSVGRVVHTWKRDGDRYTLSSVTEASGFFSLIKPGKLVQTSEGLITEQGLQPASFWVQRGQSTDTTEFAQFNWKNGSLRFGTYQDARTVELPDTAQDLMSFLYQFAFAPPASGSIKLYIANGRKLDTYDYTVIGEEVLELPFGKVKALHLSKQHTANESGTEIWLSVDHRYFPVKIRQVEKDGGVAEQVANAIHLSFGSKDKEEGR